MSESPITEKLEISHSENVSAHNRHVNIKHEGTATDILPFDEDDDRYQWHPNRWARIRHALREPFAEFLGTLILVLFGTSVDCQVFLSMNSNVVSTPRGDYLSLNFAWGTGVALGVWASGAVSGGHINPAITIALATFRGFPWKKVPIYILAQLLGAFCGGAITYANYFHDISVVEGGPHIRTIAGSGDLFSTYPLTILTPVSAFFSEFLGTATLTLGVMAVTDKKNGLPASLVPLALFIILLGVGAAMGMNSSYALNPARDLGPRIFTAMAGYGREVFDYGNQYWLWCPVLAPIFGALVGTLTYDVLIYTGEDSILNKPDARATRRRLQQQRKLGNPLGV